MPSTIVEQRAAAGTICAYCGESCLTGNERPEHPIQAAIGSSWQVFTACDPCTDWAKIHVDQPFLDDDFILELRSEHDIRDQRHGRGRGVASPLSRGYTPDGLYVVADEAWQPQLRHGRIVEGPGEDEFTIIAGDRAEYDRLLKKLTLRQAAAGKTVDFGEPQISEDHPRISGRTKVRPWVWRRAVAKIALAAGSVVYDEAWRTSGDAHLLRTWMHDKDALPYDHCPIDRVSGGPLDHLIEPPYHAVFVRAGSSATVLTIVLFGDYAFRLPIDTTRRPVPNIAWYLDPHRPRVHGETTWSGLLHGMLRRRFPEDLAAA